MKNAGERQKVTFHLLGHPTYIDCTWVCVSALLGTGRHVLHCVLMYTDTDKYTAVHPSELPSSVPNNQSVTR